MKKLRRFLEIIAFVLVVSLCISSKSFQIVSSAVGEDIRDSKLYISEVKMFYGRDENDARTLCEKDGYILCFRGGGKNQPLKWLIFGGRVCAV